MNPHLTIQGVTDYISAYIKDRFVVENRGELHEILKFLGDGVGEVEVYRVKRKATSTNTWRTILFALIFEPEDYHQALKWAAAAREELLNTEPSDLYLFILPVGCSISLETCINIESSDLFCRKYVSRPSETLVEVINRSFLCSPATGNELDDIVDPLMAALLKTGSDLDFFSNVDQENWKRAILSDQSGAELAEYIFNGGVA